MFCSSDVTDQTTQVRDSLIPFLSHSLPLTEPIVPTTLHTCWHSITKLRDDHQLYSSFLSIRCNTFQHKMYSTLFFLFIFVFVLSSLDILFLPLPLMFFFLASAWTVHCTVNLLIKEGMLYSSLGRKGGYRTVAQFTRVF
jgi:hypothetical protein